MELIHKFKDLEASHTYCVLGYDGPIKSKYGNTYVLKIKDVKYDSEFQIWSTASLTKYISDNRPTEKFTFIVKEKNDIKYPMIEGVTKERKFIMLQ